MLTYLPNDPLPSSKYGFSYQQLRDDYLRYRLMSDDDFLSHLVDILHFACYVAYVKELLTQWVLADTGIVHELVHLLIEERNQREGRKEWQVTTTSLKEIRDLFDRDCCLA
jgi:hypothetical protein